MASNRFDFPTALGPAMHVNGPKRTSTSTRFLKPFTLSRVIMSRPQVHRKYSRCVVPINLSLCAHPGFPLRSPGWIFYSRHWRFAWLIFNSERRSKRWLRYPRFPVAWAEALIQGLPDISLY